MRRQSCRQTIFLPRFRYDRCDCAHLTSNPANGKVIARKVEHLNGVFSRFKRRMLLLMNVVLEVDRLHRRPSETFLKCKNLKIKIVRIFKKIQICSSIIICTTALFNEKNVTNIVARDGASTETVWQTVKAWRGHHSSNVRSWAPEKIKFFSLS